MIDINKKYRLRNGWEARIYATDGSDYSFCSVHAAYKHPEHGWVVGNWHSNGSWLFGGINHDYDLVEVKPRIKRTFWLNVYPARLLAYSTKNAADYNANKDRIACVRVEIDVEEGHGLEGDNE
jgi:hypothetical protein